MEQAYFIQPYIAIADIAGKGRGIIALQNIDRHTIVELSPAIVMDAAARALLDQTKLHDYIFEWGEGDTKLCCMAQGYVSVYNHSSLSNCEYFMDFDNETIYIKTMRPITKGEELTINYNGDWDNAGDVWFAEKE